MRLADSGVINPSNTTWKFTVNMTPGIAPPAGTGPQSFTVTTAINCGTNTPATCTANAMDISTLLSASAPALSNSSGSPFNRVLDVVAQFGVIADTSWVVDAVYNTAQTTCGSGTGLPAGTCVTISSTDPPFVCPGGGFPCTSGGDAGKLDHGTYNCSDANPGACIEAVPQGTIVKVWDSTHVQVSVAATHSSVNSGSNGSNFAWGSAGNQAKLATASTYMLNNPGTALSLPCGTASNAPSAPVSGGSGAIGIDGVTGTAFSLPLHLYPVGIFGCPGGGTLFIGLTSNPAPQRFLLSSFTIGAFHTGVGGGDQFKDFTFWGLGVDTGSGLGGNEGWITISGPALVSNVWVIGWFWNLSNAFTFNGFLLNNGTAINSGSYTGGNFPCSISSSAFPVKLTGAVCGGSNSPGLTISGSGGAGFASSGVIVDNSLLYGTTSAIYGVVNTASVPVTLQGNTIGGISQTGSSILNLIGNGIDRFTNNAPFAISNAGGTIIAQGNIINGDANAFLNQSSGSFIDNCGNKISNLTTPTITGGTFVGNCSSSGTVPVTGNFALTNATFSSVTGTDQRHFTLNITASAAAAITIVYTFPTAFNVAPGSCKAQDVGGTNPLLTFSNSVAQTTTAVTFLSSAAAVNTDTVQVAIDCN